MKSQKRRWPNNHCSPLNSRGPRNSVQKPNKNRPSAERLGTRHRERLMTRSLVTVVKRWARSIGRSFIAEQGREASHQGQACPSRRFQVKITNSPYTGALSATKPLAECICRTRDWQHPTRLPGSCRRVERSSFEANPDQLFQLLSLLAHASVARDG
jgi:hypothetical protein